MAQSRFFKPATPQEYDMLMRILQENQDKDFVQRILDPGNSPKLKVPGGYATHRMAWSTVDDKAVVYPTVMPDPQQPGRLKDYDDQGFDEAKRRGEMIEMPSGAAAEWFSSRYKAAWGGLMNKPPE